MTIVNGTFTAAEEASAGIRVAHGHRFIWTLEGTWSGVLLVRQRRAGGGWTTVGSCTAVGVQSYDAEYDSEFDLYAESLDSGTVVYRIEDADYATLGVGSEWDDMRFPAQGINPAGAVAAPTVETDEAKFPGTLLFSPSSVQMIAGVTQMPHSYQLGTPLRPHLHWQKTTSASGKVIWHFYYRISSRSGASGAWIGPVVGVDDLSDFDTADREAIATFGYIPPTGINLSQMLAWRVYRKADDAADTYAADARLLEVDIHYQMNSAGSGGEFAK